MGAAQFHSERDDSLLGTVVQVTLDTSAGLVGGGDHAGPGPRQLNSCVVVVDRSGNEVGEVGQSISGLTAGRILRSCRADDDGTPGIAVDSDRYTFDPANTPALQSLSDTAGRFGEVDGSGAAGVGDDRGHVLPTDRQLITGLHALTGGVVADRQNRVIPVAVADHRNMFVVQPDGEFVCDCEVHVIRIGPQRHQCCDLPK